MYSVDSTPIFARMISRIQTVGRAGHRPHYGGKVIEDSASLRVKHENEVENVGGC